MECTETIIKLSFQRINEATVIISFHRTNMNQSELKNNIHLPPNPKKHLNKKFMLSYKYKLVQLFTLLTRLVVSISAKHTDISQPSNSVPRYMLYNKTSINLPKVIYKNVYSSIIYNGKNWRIRSLREQGLWNTHTMRMNNLQTIFNQLVQSHKQREIKKKKGTKSIYRLYEWNNIKYKTRQNKDMLLEVQIVIILVEESGRSHWKGVGLPEC